MNKRVGILALVATLVTSMAIATVSACDTRTPGYWKTHYPEAWPTTRTTFDDSWEGSRTYDMVPADALAILRTPVKGDASINLQQKVIAAQLSILADQRDGWGYELGNYGGDTDLIELVDQALAWLEDHPTCPPGADGRAEGLALASAIDYWLNYFDVE